MSKQKKAQTIAQEAQKAIEGLQVSPKARAEYIIKATKEGFGNLDMKATTLKQCKNMQAQLAENGFSTKAYMTKCYRIQHMEIL
jgi:hypothetical protein